jgi:DNA gyrase subunit B
MSEEHTALAGGERMGEDLLEAGVTPNGDYNEGSVGVLRDYAHIRRRPDMYIGGTGIDGLHHLVHELVANSLDEALAGFCRRIDVKINPDGSVSVSDDGRGIPVEEHPLEKKSTLEVVMTTVGAGAKFDKGTYRVSSGLHGMGAKAVTALSEWSEAQVQRNGRTYRQEYERGQATTPVMDIGASLHTGTRVTFFPDPQIFHDLTFSYDTLESRLRELAFLNKGLTLAIHDERAGKQEVFKFDGGLAAFVEYINHSDDTVSPIIVIEKVLDVPDPMHPDQPPGKVSVEVALQYRKGEDERFRCYTNNAFNSNGGTHLSGFRSALTRTLNAYGTKADLFKNVSPTGEDFRDGLTVVISVQVPEPKFDSQEKRRLTNQEVEGAVASVVGEVLGRYLEEHPKEAKLIMNKVIVAAEAREAARKAKDAAKARKSILNGGGLPGKLYDCNGRQRDKSELFLVEGDSAGGSAVEGRNNEYQAILPLRGKPLNVEKARLDNLLKNEEITSLISAIGIDIGNTQTVEEVKDKLRYGKVIIMTDADVDGQHIRTLLLTFFYRQMPRLVEEGRIYVARPPLYKVTEKKHVRFVQTADEMQRELAARGLKNTRLAVFPKGEAGSPAAPAPPAPPVIEGSELEALLEVMTRMEKALVILERRGVSLAAFVGRVSERGLPTFHVLMGGREEWCFTREEVEALRRREQERLGRDLVVADELAPANAQGNGHVATFDVHELHEVREINRCLGELKSFGLGAADLVPAVRVAGREPPVRLRLESGEHGKVLAHLRDLVAEVRKLGEKGLAITRFKGLGEMDPQELWDTTLDPEQRTLMQVRLDDALKADEMFRTLMGEKVEPRRDFIQKYGIDVKDIDYHGA